LRHRVRVRVGTLRFAHPTGLQDRIIEGEIVIANLIAKARKLAAILAVPAWRAALRRHRVAAGVEHARVLRNLGSLRTVVDIGANRGQFAFLQ